MNEGWRGEGGERRRRRGMGRDMGEGSSWRDNGRTRRMKRRRRTTQLGLSRTKADPPEGEARDRENG